jgi:2-oxoglutarate ferredoxin oxidoreductase subunit beta
MVQAVMEHPFLKYLRSAMIPHIWCPGCGNGIVLNCFVQALDELGMDLDRLVVVSGIGCIGRTAGYTNTDSFHTTHGRALAFASGVKLANPELEVVVVSGDGDLFAIGGNHFIHAARRNMGIKVVCVNNFNYGMTGGQQGPTTPLEAFTTTSPYGNIEHPFNLVHLAAASGAVYVARWTTLHVRRLTQSVKKALQKEGFCFIEVVSPCPEIFGRYNRMRSGLEMMEWFKKASVVQSFSDPGKAEIGLERIVVGEFVDIEKLSYEKLLHEKISQINERALEQVG